MARLAAFTAVPGTAHGSRGVVSKWRLMRTLGFRQAHSARPWDVGTSPLPCRLIAHLGSLRTPVGCWDRVARVHPHKLTGLTPHARGMLGQYGEIGKMADWVAHSARPWDVGTSK